MDQTGRHLRPSEESDIRDGQLTVRSAGSSSRRLNRRPTPALDGVQDAFLLLTTRSKAGHLTASNDRLAGGGVNDAGEDGASVAPMLD